jgi:hypothetical protein
LGAADGLEDGNLLTKGEDLQGSVGSALEDADDRQHGEDEFNEIVPDLSAPLPYPAHDDADWPGPHLSMT